LVDLLTSAENSHVVAASVGYIMYRI